MKLFSHEFAGHTTDVDLKRQLATVRRVERQTVNFYMNMGRWRADCTSKLP